MRTLKIEEMGFAKLLHTTNVNFKKYEGKKGKLQKFYNDKNHIYYFDMIRYFIQTSLVKFVENTEDGILEIITSNSVYRFEINEKYEWTSLSGAVEKIE